MFTKFASLEVGQILEVKGSQQKITGAGLDKLASYEDYRTDDGYLYTRVRAISSRVNKNHDGWPSEELAKSYLTFVGKPIFVDHNNSDPGRARGVIVDAKLHIENDFEKASALDPYYSSAPENHKPPTWIELLLEVDAKQFPKLARAIVADDIDGVSMGANVERSKCSHCGNWATSPEEYCDHVMQKGATFDLYDEFGRKTASPSYEDCYDIGFFEISYVFDPADETALDLGDKRHAIAKTADYQQNWDDVVADRKAEHRSPNQCDYCEGAGCDECAGQGHLSIKEPFTPPLKNYDHLAGEKESFGYPQSREDRKQYDRDNCPECKGEGCRSCHPKTFEEFKKSLPGMGTVGDIVDHKMSKTAGPMDMGGYGDGSAPAAAPTSTTPQLPGPQDQNCPQCGGVMQDGLCPQCSTTPDNNGVAGTDPSAGMTTGSFRIARDGVVHYAEWYDDNPIEGDDTMEQLRQVDNATDEEVQGISDSMGFTLQDWADQFLATTANNPSSARDQMMRAFPTLGLDVVTDEIGKALARQRGIETTPDLPADPFKISKDGTVHYAQPELPQSMHMTSPEDVNTLRQEKICDVCGSDMDDGKCDVCNYEVPPEGFDNPDLTKALEVAEQAGAAAAGGMGEAPPGAMAPPGGAPGGMGTPAPGGPPPPGAGGGAPMASTRKASGTPTVKVAGKIRSNEQPVIPATKTVSDHPKTTTVTKEPTRLVQSNTKDNMTQLTKAEVVAQMVKRGTSGVKTAADAEKILKETGLDRLLAANPASDPAEHSQSVDQVGGEVDNAEGDTQHINVEKAVDIEKIPTMTWSDGKGDSLGQESPVTSDKFEGGGPIGVAASTEHVAEGQSGVTGDPTNAEKQVDVTKPMMADGVVGPETQTFKSDDFHVGDPVTTEDSNMVGGPIGTPLSSVQRSQIVAHVLGALKLAEEMVEVGLISDEQKFDTAAQLEQETPEQLQVRRDMLVQTKRAGLGKTVASKGKLPLAGNSSRTASVSHDIADDHFGDAGLFR